MGTERNIVSKELNRIKEKHKLTHKSWSEISGVPVGTVSRYLGYNLGVPNFAHICAMLGSVNESVDDFYKVVNGAIQQAVANPEVISDTPPVPKIDLAQDASALRSMKERVIEQNEAVLSYLAEIHEQDAQLRVLRAEMRSMEKTIFERDAHIVELNSELKCQRDRNRRSNIAAAILMIVVILMVAIYIWDVFSLHQIHA